MRVRPVVLMILLVACVILAPQPSGAAVVEPDVPIETIIERFIDKETEFSKAREAYIYRHSVKILEYSNSGSVRGRWEMVQDVLFDADSKRVEKVIFAPPSSLKNLMLTPEDMEDLRSVQPFVMTRENAHEYRIDYLGEQRVDEIDTYMFSVKPKQLVKGRRYFEGQIWVDQIGLQIVKTYGKGVGKVDAKKDHQFPRFETYRDQIDGEYWFPVYTRADDTLPFRSGPQKIRMIIKYENYKRFLGTSTITFGDVVEEDGQSGGEQPQP